MAAAVFNLQSDSYKDLTQFVNTDPPEYTPIVLEPLYTENSNRGAKDKTRDASEFDENAVIRWLSDEDESPTRMTSRSKTQTSKRSSASTAKKENEDESVDQKMAQLKEEEPDVLEFTDQFDLADDTSWGGVPKNHIVGRFQQYRNLTVEALAEYEEKVAGVMQRTSRKVQTLKAQFQEHKARWEKERQLLVATIDQTEAQKTEAQGYAERAVDQMEKFISGTEEMIANNNDNEGNNSDENNRDEREKALHVKVALLEMQKGEMENKLAEQESEFRQLEERLLQQTDDAMASAEQLRALQEEIATRRSVSNASDHVTAERNHESRLSAMKSTVETARSGQSGHTASEHTIQVEEEVKRIRSTTMDTLEIDEEADMPFPPDHPENEDNSMTVLRKGVSIAEHPVVQEYVKTYKKLVNFKDKLGKIFLEQEIKEKANELLNTKMHEFDKASKVVPQVEEMGKHVTIVLDQIIILIQNIVVAMDMSSKLGDADTGQLKMELADLHNKYDALKSQMEESNKKYEEQINSSTATMMEMQKTIATLRRELTELNDHRGDQLHVTPAAMVREPTIIFTRNDTDRNTRALKRALSESRLDPETYELALAGMSQYTRLPAQRLAHLARRYLHEDTMRNIAEQVRQQQSVDPDLLHTLDRIEQLEAKRTRRYGAIMNFLTAERLRLANTLLDTFEDIEQRSSIFLIKPTLSLRSRDELRAYYSLLRDKLKKESDSNHPGAPPSASTDIKLFPQPAPTGHTQITIRAPVVEGPPALVAGIGFEAADLPPSSFWTPGATQQPASRSNLSDRMSIMNTPRLLELDINRMLLGQNNISVPYESSERPDKTTLTPHNAVRSYVTVARPAAQSRTKSLVQDQSDRVPPSTPQVTRVVNSAEGRLSGGRRSKDLSGAPALPPISPTPRDELDIEEEKPESG